MRPPAVRAGLLAQEEHLRLALGVAIRGDVEVRVSWWRGCEPGMEPNSGPTAYAQRGFLCRNAAHPQWRLHVERDAWYPSYVAAHELLHVWQAELGCHHPVGEQRWQWLFEGMAEHLAFAALERSGAVNPAQALTRIRQLGGLDPALGDLAGYETPTDRTAHAYPCSTSPLCI